MKKTYFTPKTKAINITSERRLLAGSPDMEELNIINENLDGEDGDGKSQQINGWTFG